MKLKNKKKKSSKFIILLLLSYFIFSYTFYNSFKNNQNIANEEFINFLLNNGNANFTNKYELPKVIHKTMNYLLKIDITKPYTLFNENIIGYTEKEQDEYSNLEELKQISYYIEDPNKVDIENPIVYIYNSHQLENYDSDNLDIYVIFFLFSSYLTLSTFPTKFSSLL